MGIFLEGIGEILASKRCLIACVSFWKHRYIVFMLEYVSESIFMSVIHSTLAGNKMFNFVYGLQNRK